MCIDTNARSCLYGPSTSDLSDREIVTVTPPLFYIRRRRWSVDFDQRLLKNDHRDFNCLISMKPSLSTTQACTISTKVGMIFLVLLEKVVGRSVSFLVEIFEKHRSVVDWVFLMLASDF